MKLQYKYIGGIIFICVGMILLSFGLSPKSALALAIGDNYQGGKVAYILQPGDLGYIEGQTKGLIVATSDQSTGAEWGCFGTAITGADGTAIGTGNQNTIDIMAGCGEAGIAARLAGDLVEGGYSDWYLPSQDELNKLYLNKDAIGASGQYWSSSEGQDENFAWDQIFDEDGGQFDEYKNNSFSVRAVRSFTVTPDIIPTPSDGGGRARTTTIIFSGKAFPNAKILVVAKDAAKDIALEEPISQDLITDAEGKFSVGFFYTTQGQQSFGLLIKDKDNRATQTKFFNIDIFGDDLVAKDILVPPTVGLPQRLVSQGQPAIVVGNASPNNSVILEIDDIIKEEANVEKDGSYKVAVDTGILEFGTHYVRVKQVDIRQKRESDYSPTNAFVVSRLLLPKTDLSGDGVVDIKDWSIFLSKWGLKDETQKKIIDFNDDGKINISDFSIFIRNIKK